MWKSKLIPALLFLFTVSTVSGVGTHYSMPSIGEQSYANWSAEKGNWSQSREIDFESRWDGDNTWGGDHKMLAVRLNTQKLISQGKMRRDCADLRVEWDDRLATSKVEAGTCGTTDTWVYFSNRITQDGYMFNTEKEIENITVYYGNPEPESTAPPASPSNRNNPASMVHPEGLVEMYFGTHCGNTYTSHNTDLHSNDRSAPSQTWHVGFNHCHSGDPGTNTIHISDDDGNSVHRNSGDTYTLDSGNAPSWLDGGDTVTVHFHSNSASADSTSSTSSNQQATWGNSAPSLSNPSPTGNVEVTDVPMSVDVSGVESTVDVTFYDITGSSTSTVGYSAEGKIPVEPDEPRLAAGYHSGGQQDLPGDMARPANYTELESNWSHSRKLNFSSIWDGDLRWGGDHKVFSFPMDTKKLVKQGKMRKDCKDLRVGWKGQTVPTRVEAGTCGTQETWVYFSNAVTQLGYRFPQDATVEQIELFYGNPTPPTEGMSISPANRRQPASKIHPEGLVEMYFGTHCGNTYTSHNTDLHSNDRSAPSQTWHASFGHCHYGDPGTDTIHISDDDGNSVHRNSGDTYTLDSGNAPSWLDGGDTVTVHFHSNSAGDGSSTSSSNRNAVYGRAFPGNPIDTVSLNSDGTASITWNNRQCGQTYEWYAVGQQGQGYEILGNYTFTVDCNDPPRIDSGPSFANEAGHTFGASADISDPDGTSTIRECRFTASSSTTSDTYTDSNPGSTCSVSGINYNDLNAGHTENIDVTVTVEDDSGETDLATGSHSFPNHNPSTSDPSFADYIGSHAFNVTVPVDDQDNGNSEVDSCEWQFTSGSDTYTETNSPSTDAGSTSCKFANFSAAKNGFDVGDTVDVSLTARDLHGGTATASGSHTLDNTRPVFSRPKPPNASIVSSEVPELSIRVNDPEERTLNIYFRNSANGALIGTDEVRSGKRGATEWEGLSAGKTYDWYVQVSDGYSNVSNQARDWNFTKTLSGDYRLRTHIQNRYTSIITSVNKPSYVTYVVQSPVSSNKTVTTKLQGVNAEFSDGSQSRTYRLGPYERRQFQILIEPSQNGTRSLEITSTEEGTGITNTDRIEVLVKELKTSTGNAEEVPGLQLVQLMVLMSAGAFFYMRML